LNNVGKSDRIIVNLPCNENRVTTVVIYVFIGGMVLNSGIWFLCFILPIIILFFIILPQSRRVIMTLLFRLDKVNENGIIAL
jgi:hypothetical protein